MPRRLVVPDPTRCLGCYTCLAACALAHKEEGVTPVPRLFLTPLPQGSVPLPCRHCDEAPCARVCPVGAIEPQAQAVVLNEKKCVGCGICALACPIGCIEIQVGRQMSPSAVGLATSIPLPAPAGEQDEKKVRKVAVKCDLCYFRPDGPACIRACPTKALVLLDAGDVHLLAVERRKAHFGAAAVDVQRIYP
ncbi:MAG: 4Fe-4S dicluster domain-containing protein [Bacillota bacterium]|nr:4Fe-4S dicluster domain-containing protein [Bacillota bacterium]